MTRILILIFFSQILYLGVFWAVYTQYYVADTSKNLCWSFIRGSQESPNWLPSTWKVLEEINTDQSVQSYCKKKWFRFAWVPIWTQYISDERAWAEFLAWKWIIETRNLEPSLYKLDQTISRKEMMKIISKVWKLDINQDSCKRIFSDVEDDWGCKYIEVSLEEGYITWNEKFRPNESITQSEALKLIFKAKNITKRYDTWAWQEDYISSAYYLSFIDEKFSYYNSQATRGWIFQVLLNSYNDLKTD